MNFYEQLELILELQNPSQKIERFKKFYELYQKGGVMFEKEYPVKKFEKPSYISTCRIVPPQKVPKRNNALSKEGRINLIHAIAHIEYSAIDLALDAAYRFRELPKQYYDDWLEVAEDEVRHFLMLHEILEIDGAKYGDVSVHNALFEASQRTQGLLERMAVVPRYLEANGLDATPSIIQKLQRLPENETIEKIIQSLKLIVYEEIEHVKKGDHWFRYACQEQNLCEDVYFEIIDKYYPQGFSKPRNVNLAARKEAGFSCNELNKIAKEKVC